MKKPTAEVSSAAKAEIVRALYDAADRIFEARSMDGSSPEEALSASGELQRVILQARQLGGEEFAQSVELAVKKYTELASAVEADYVSKSDKY